MQVFDAHSWRPDPACCCALHKRTAWNIYAKKETDSSFVLQPSSTSAPGSSTEPRAAHTGLPGSRPAPLCSSADNTGQGLACKAQLRVLALCGESCYPVLRMSVKNDSKKSTKGLCPTANFSAHTCITEDPSLYTATWTGAVSLIRAAFTLTHHPRALAIACRKSPATCISNSCPKCFRAEGNICFLLCHTHTVQVTKSSFVPLGIVWCCLWNTVHHLWHGSCLSSASLSPGPGTTLLLFQECSFPTAAQLHTLAQCAKVDNGRKLLCVLMGTL